MRADPKQILETFSKLKQARNRVTGDYESVARYCLPEWSDAPADEQISDDPTTPRLAVNSIGALAAQRLASGLFANTISLTDLWFRYGPLDSEKASAAWKRYFAECSHIAFNELGKSNFHTVLHEMLLDYAVFGTGVCYPELPMGEPLAFTRIPVMDSYFSEDSHSRVNRLFRSMQYTVEQLKDDFQGAVPDGLSTDPMQKFLVIHAVYKRQEKNESEKEYASVYVLDHNGGVILSEKGYDAFPFSVARFQKSTRGAYARSPATLSLADISMLQRIEQDVANSAELAMSPPLFVPDDDAVVDLVPGAVNPMDMSRGKPQEYQVGAIAFQEGAAYLDRKEERIRQAFFVDLFLALENQKNMSATEVVARVNEKVQSLAPMVSRLLTGFYSSILLRVFDLLKAAGRFPDPPDAQGAKMHVTFTTRMQAKLMQVDSENVLRFIQQAAGVISMLTQAPALAAFVDTETVIRRLADNNNVDPRLVYSKAKSKQIQEAMAQAQAAQAQQQAVQQTVKPVDALKAPEPGSLGAQLTEGAQQGVR